jgi:hypothetical protein
MDEGEPAEPSDERRGDCGCPSEELRGGRDPWINKEPTVKTATVVGIVLVIIGVVALAYGGISYTKEEKVLDLGPIEATAERQKMIPLPPLLGGLALAGGVALLIAGARKS